MVSRFRGISHLETLSGCTGAKRDVRVREPELLHQEQAPDEHPTNLPVI